LLAELETLSAVADRARPPGCSELAKFQDRGHADLERDLDELGPVACFEGRLPYGTSYILFVMGADSTAGRRAHLVRDLALAPRPGEES
jgi:hypothetical protein